MKKFKRIKLFVDENGPEIQGFVTAIAYGIVVCTLGYKLGLVVGQRDGILNCNKLWMNFAEKCQKEDEA